MPMFLLPKARLATLSVLLAPFCTGVHGIAQTSSISTTVRLVTVDVSAIGKDGMPVSGLDCGDFELKEDGKEQTLRHCEEHHASEANDAAASRVKVAGQPNMFTNASVPALPPAIDIFLVDFLNARQEDRPKMTDAVKRLLRTTAQGTSPQCLHWVST